MTTRISENTCGMSRIAVCFSSRVYTADQTFTTVTNGVAGGSTEENVFFYHTDPVGTPVAMTDHNGDKVWEADYLPFGDEYDVDAVIANDRRFVNKEKDEETGLSYFGARYMDTGIGRFLAADPVKIVGANGQINQAIMNDPQRLNMYSYGLNNPYRYVDPDGREVISFFDIATGVLSTTDLDTRQTVNTSAYSGGNPYGESIKEGKYDILDHPNKDFFRLESVDGKYGDDTHNQSGHNKYRLHKPGRSTGCIAGKCEEGWKKTRNMIRSTKTSTTTVDSKSRNPFAPKHEKINKFGTLHVVNTKKKKD